MRTERKRKASSLKKRIVSLITFCIVLLAAVSIISGSLTSYNGLLQNVNKDLNSIGQIADVAISKELEDIKSTAKEAQKIDRSASNKNAERDLQTFCKENGYDGVAIVTASGTVDTTDDVLKNVKFTEDSYFKEALQGNVTIGTTVSNGSDGVFVPVYVPVDNNQSVIVCRLPGTVFSDIIKNIRVGDTGNVFILDKKGIIVGNMRPELVKVRTDFITDGKTDSSKAEAAAVYSEMVSGKSGVSQYSYSGVERVCSYRPITNGNGWSLGAVAPIGEMTSSITSTIFFMTLFIVLSAVACEVITIKVVKKITKPITDCADRLTKLSEGDLHSEVPTTDANDETGILLKQLDVTMTRLRTVVQGISDYLASMANGDLSLKDPPQYRGDFAQVSKSIATILASLNHVVQQIEQSSSEVTSGSEQIAAGAQALSQGATEQASSVEELAATIQGISKQVEANTRHANKAETKAVETAKELENGKADMQQMLGAMREISDSSGQIGKIIKSIQDIAFQTNILALNAAVEAARAGEAGKGFAVVADEVRNLANKSQEASQETTKMIERSVTAVESGTKIAHETAASMDRIVAASDVSTEMVHKISSASQEQDVAIQQVTQGMDQISSVVQTNSATAEESAAASEELSGQAAMLKKLVSYFKLRDGSDTALGSMNDMPSVAPENPASYSNSEFTNYRQDKY